MYKVTNAKFQTDFWFVLSREDSLLGRQEVDLTIGC